MSIQRYNCGTLPASKRFKSIGRIAFVCTFLFLLVGCAQGTPLPGSVLPTQLPTTLPTVAATPASPMATHWSVQALTPDYPLQKIEVAGTYEQIGYALGKWYQDRGFSARPLTDDEQESARELLRFYEGVHPSILAQLRGIYTAYGLSLDEANEAIPVLDNKGIRILLPGLVESSSCSIAFTRPELAADGHARLGRNYDWMGAMPDTYLVFSQPEGSYATVVMTAHTPGLTAADGLNSQGLALGFASVRNLGYELPTGPALAASVAYRLILETCANVEEAIALLRSVPITFINPSPDELITHLLVADRSGASAVVEFLPEGIVVSRSDAPYQVMTNSLWAGPADQPDCPRYRTAVERLEAARSKIDTEGLMAVLASMHSTTLWTTIYDLEDLSLVLALPSVDPSTYYEFSLADFQDIGPPTGTAVSSEGTTLTPTAIVGEEPTPTARPPTAVSKPTPTAVDYRPVRMQGWEVSTPAEEELDPKLVADLYRYAAQLPSLYGLLVVKNGHLIAEGYFNGSGRGKRADLASVTKSYTSALIGIALEQGCLSSVDQPMLDFFPEYADQIQDPRKEQITIGDMLKMRSGYPWEEFAPPYLDLLVSSNNWLPDIVEFPLTSDPGTEFGYSNLTAHLLGVIVARACGTSLLSYGQQHLFSPMNARAGDWWRDANGYYYGSGGISFTARDAAKFGLLYLNHGQYAGKQVVPADWVRDSLQTYSRSLYNNRLGTYFRDIGYGYLWWSARAGDHQFNYAWGHGGNLIILLDELDMVIVTTANPLPGVWGQEAWEKEGAIIDLVGRFIKSIPKAPALSSTPTPPGPSAAIGTQGAGASKIRDKDGAVQVYVPGGTFHMGSSENDPGAGSDEVPRHSVTLDGFWIDQTEVTNAQFVAFLNEQGNQSGGGAPWLDLEQGYCLIEQVDGRYRLRSDTAAARPVVMVSWYGADAYCKWVGGRLPTEAEWEYAARGPDVPAYPWGSDAPTCERAVFQGCASCARPVRSLPAGASWCGALDMAGNVWEWVADWYGGYASAPQENPAGPPFGEYRVMRGGGWHATPREVRAAHRSYGKPFQHIGCVGFRCVLPSATSASPTTTSVPTASTDTPNPPTGTATPAATPTATETPTSTEALAFTLYPEPGTRLDARSYGGRLNDLGYDSLLLDDGGAPGECDTLSERRETRWLVHESINQ